MSGTTVNLKDVNIFLCGYIIHSTMSEDTIYDRVAKLEDDNATLKETVATLKETVTALRSEVDVINGIHKNKLAKIVVRKAKDGLL